ncbi:TolB family protein [Deferrisoma palaeochoriense]
MTRAGILLFLCLAGLPVGALAAPGVERVVALSLGPLEGRGQPAALATDREGASLAFEFLGAEGDTLEVYLAPFKGGGPLPSGLGPPEAVVPAGGTDPFALKPERPLSEGPSFGPPKRGQPRLVVAATRKAASRGASVVNLDLFLREPGRRAFLTDHPENDANPAFSPDGTAVAFTSGRTGQGDLYLYRFRGEPAGLVRLTFEPAGSELYPAWFPGGDRLAFVAHLGTSDHVAVLDRLGELAAADEGARRLRVREHLRDLTPGWAGACLAPSVSPDGRWVAFLSRRDAAGPADLYAVPAQGGEPRLVCRGVLPETRGGPRWTPDGRGFVVVLDDADRLNPLAHVALDGPGEPRVLPTGTELNADPWVVRRGGRTVVLFTAQGAVGQAEKRWRRVYAALLREERE